MLASLQGFEVGRKAPSGMLDFFDCQRKRFVIHNFDASPVTLSSLSGNEESRSWQQFDRWDYVA